MPRTHYTLIERTALGDQLHKGPLAVHHRKMMKLLREAEREWYTGEVVTRRDTP